MPSLGSRADDNVLYYPRKCDALSARLTELRLSMHKVLADTEKVRLLVLYPYSICVYSIKQDTKPTPDVRISNQQSVCMILFTEHAAELISLNFEASTNITQNDVLNWAEQV